jgi:hypothetical protein
MDLDTEELEATRNRMIEKNKIIIHNYSDLEDFECISFIRAVISDGKISKTKQGEQYCFATTFKNGIVVNCSRRNNTYTFTVNREK